MIWKYFGLLIRFRILCSFRRTWTALDCSYKTKIWERIWSGLTRTEKDSIPAHGLLFLVTFARRASRPLTLRMVGLRRFYLDEKIFLQRRQILIENVHFSFTAKAAKSRSFPSGAEQSIIVNPKGRSYDYPPVAVELSVLLRHRQVDNAVPSSAGQAIPHSRAIYLPFEIYSAPVNQSSRLVLPLRRCFL